MTQLAKGDRVRVKAGLGHQYGRIEDASPDMKGRVLVRLGNDLERKSLDRVTRIGGSPPIPPSLERAPNRGRMEFVPQPKDIPARDRTYLDWLRGLPCAFCGQDAHRCEASHHGKHGHSTKPSDHDALPACGTGTPNNCHGRWHAKGSPAPWMDSMTREERAAFFQMRAAQLRERWER